MILTVERWSPGVAIYLGRSNVGLPDEIAVARLARIFAAGPTSLCYLGYNKTFITHL